MSPKRLIKSPALDRGRIRTLSLTLTATATVSRDTHTKTSGRKDDITRYAAHSLQSVVGCGNHHNFGSWGKNSTAIPNKDDWYVPLGGPVEPTMLLAAVQYYLVALV